MIDVIEIFVWRFSRERRYQIWKRLPARLRARLPVWDYWILCAWWKDKQFKSHGACDWTFDDPGGYNWRYYTDYHIGRLMIRIGRVNFG